MDEFIEMIFMIFRLFSRIKFSQKYNLKVIVDKIGIYIYIYVANYLYIYVTYVLCMHRISGRVRIQILGGGGLTIFLFYFEP